MRRTVGINRLADAVAECERLLSTGYTKQGKWSLGQICQHIRLTIECNMTGYPTWMTVLAFPLRPILRRFGLPKLLAGRAPKGIPTAPMFVSPGSVDDAQEVEAFARCVEKFMSWEGALLPHPGFGSMSHEEFEKFHTGHMAHHLGFLEIKG